jgi:hypothetical protein
MKQPVGGVDDGLEHPNGAVPAISSGAIGLLAILVAFVAYADFRVRPDAPWRWGDAPPVVLALGRSVLSNHF